MASEESANGIALRQADFSRRAAGEVNEAERAELTRRYDSFMHHFRAGRVASAPSTGMARRIRKWRP